MWGGRAGLTPSLASPWLKALAQASVLQGGVPGYFMCAKLSVAAWSLTVNSVTVTVIPPAWIPVSAGNGIESILYDRPDIMYISLHRCVGLLNADLIILLWPRLSRSGFQFTLPPSWKDMCALRSAPQCHDAVDCSAGEMASILARAKCVMWGEAQAEAST